MADTAAVEEAGEDARRRRIQRDRRQGANEGQEGRVGTAAMVSGSDSPAALDIGAWTDRSGTALR